MFFDFGDKRLYNHSTKTSMVYDSTSTCQLPIVKRSSKLMLGARFLFSVNVLTLNFWFKVELQYVLEIHLDKLAPWGILMDLISITS